MNKYAKAISKYSSRYERIKIVDFLRGFCAILMIFDHTMYDLIWVAGPLWGYSKLSIQLSSLATRYWSSSLRRYGWICAVSCFVFLCGFSTGLSRSNLLRGFRLAVVSMLITIVTSLMEIVINMNGVTINFGILHTLSFCILGYALCVEGGKKIKLFNAKRRAYYLSDLLTILLFIASSIVILTYGVQASAHKTIYPYPFKSLSEMSINDYIPYALGIYKTLPSSDYIPVLPWFVVFLTGAFFAGSIKRKRKYVFKKEKSDFISFVGRHSLLLYIAHQPVIYAIMYIIGVITTGRIILF